jgi:hypothetical protein
VDDPLARHFDDRFIIFSEDAVTYDEISNRFRVNDDQDEAVDFEFRNPDFNFLQFRSNLVVRWEYRPSSTIFLVWAQGVTGGADPEKNVVRALQDDLFNNEIQNTFLIKATYRWVR